MKLLLEARNTNGGRPHTDTKMRIWANCLVAKLLLLEPLKVDVKSPIVGGLLLLVIRTLSYMILLFLLMHV